MKDRKQETKADWQDDEKRQGVAEGQRLNPQSSSLSPLPTTYPFDADGALCREFLLERGYCCGNGCRNCPYDEA